MARPKFYLTTPIYYVNARPHLGHTYTTVVADAIARYKRMRGFDAVLLTGTDEHGQKVEQSARKAGVTPQEFTDAVAADFRSLWDDLQLDYRFFVRTTEDRHARAVGELFRRAKEAGHIYEDKYSGQYCVSCELYVTDTGDDNRCPDCGRETEHVEEENYFFRLSAFQEPLLKLYEGQPDFIQPESRRNEVVSFVKSGLRDLSISRARLKWGIPIPDDPEHVFYVWFDALTSYMTGVGFGDDSRKGEYERLWPADVHLVGKEIVRFHAVYWPAFLMAAGLPLPKKILAHGWWVFDQEKMSKSRGNIVRPQPIVEVLGIDALRYFLLREMILGQDSNFSYDILLTRYNSDLANDYGNLVSRTLNMIERYCDGAMPEGANAGADEQTIIAEAKKTVAAALEFYDNYEFSRALEAVWALIASLNKYLVKTKPWELAGGEADRERLQSVLWAAAEGLRVATALLAPVIPEAAQKVWEQLGFDSPVESEDLETLPQRPITPGRRLGSIEGVFPRQDKDKAASRMEELEAQTQEPSAVKGEKAVSEDAPRITIDDFAKVELRVAEVKAAERVPKADRLLKLTVDLGDEVRQILAGIAEHYDPDSLIGKKIIVVANLQPRKMRGLESNGMLLAATAASGGKPVLATFDEAIENGARLK